MPSATRQGSLPPISITNPGTAVTAAKKEEKEIIVIPTFNGSNYANWQNTISAYLEFKKLWPVVKKDTKGSTNEKTKEQKIKAWLLLNSKIVPEILTSLTSTCGRDPHKIWKRLKNNYATVTIYGIYQVWSQYLQISYNNDLLNYIIKVEAALAKISTIGLNVMNELISVSIIETITEKRCGTPTGAGPSAVTGRESALLRCLCGDPEKSLGIRIIALNLY
ncbi:hypothetical protein PTTG_07162 [Puccinia triticina 1-1 BBBD Race 1]|uniref:DUF4219 domain-containing protein n=1 Tax=Puccinia triticina (isolate 1-1 / race 1 (BBBD)) TaxID=630390 RepID=A0A0C4F241_PUCT1|nr:hypothetical protein PTTG_07162 [Puccinia triticina 1-1 BBBD Race 1]